ncbi:helicase-exonuclease AddAB subunit AddA [Bacillus horti]|uniref:ATP-dependent helicase/nuclease subunit A n=1 Tax=Caldalkalibacillus horti TaxID=77523 RepID=A0ABT9W2W9_9BACI|nr:helicase-exonuclease AddAB subunit AddA [Bacillus horti]MDQ0167417.1 ATP-dependent helicase/nuclease subunit A [Bacillus horti]
MSPFTPIKDVPKPDGSLWTDEQWQAISARGKHILVAAAAGSGKTAVLVERMIRQITDVEHPIDVDRLLVVTFTNAAAAEMKKRIGEALEKELSKDPHSLYLKRQLTLLNQASISTLHSFCLDVLRSYYFQLDIDPKFRLAEDTEIVLIKEEVLEELFEERYSRTDDEQFFKLVDSFSSDRSDQDLQALVLQLYEFSRSHPFPYEWLKELISYTDKDRVEKWTSEILSLIRQELRGLLNDLERAFMMTQAPDGPGAYGTNIEEDLQVIHSALNACQHSWEDAFEAFNQLSFGRLKSIKSDEVNAHLQLLVKEIRDRCKKTFTSIKEEYFQRSLEEMRQDLSQMEPVLGALVELVIEFEQLFSSTKRSKAMMDFSDLEHGCLAILMEEGSTLDELRPSEVALRYKQKFSEILVDEYQDTNLVQESILKLISVDEADHGNVFMVGDVKQSIYRFRMAEPTLFLEKYKHFASITFSYHGESSHGGLESKVGYEGLSRSNVPTDETSGWKIDLARNFRSRAQVLDGTNYLFKQIMNEQVGEIEYDEDAALKLGASYPEEELPIELALIERDTALADESAGDENGYEGWNGQDGDEQDDEETGSFEPHVDEAELEAVQLEARYMAGKIKELIGTKPENAFQVYDPKHKLYRPIRYKDIVVLLRASSVWAPAILEEFKQQGIPGYAELTTGYFEATEVAIMVSLLKIIDNPYQDIPLASVLRSPIVGLQGEELARVRVADKKGSFFDAVRTFLEQNKPQVENDSDQAEEYANTQSEKQSQASDLQLYDKLTDFTQKLKRWRGRARHGSLADFIWQLYQDTGYYDFVGGMPGGNQRQANLRALYDRARQYESTSFRGLFRFLRFVERMQDRGSDLGTARALSEQEDVVRIMTIHKSKGLEFPVVFVAGLGKMFNQSDSKKKLLLHKELGLGSKFIDIDKRISYPTLPYQLIKLKMQQELLAEEMRVLYVALTRAKEKLYLLGSLRDVRKKVAQWAQQLETDGWTLPDALRSKAKTFLDWIGPAVIRHKGARPVLALVEDAMQGIQEIHSYSDSDSNLPWLNDQSQWRIEVVSPYHLVAGKGLLQELDQMKLQALANKEALVRGATDLQQEVAKKLEWSYPFLHATVTKSKQSVTELKKHYQWLLENQEVHHSLQESRETEAYLKPVKPDRPNFMQDRTLTSAERGTAMHTVMQHIELGKLHTEDELSSFIEQLVVQEKLTKHEAESVSLKQLMTFIHSDLNLLIGQADYLQREVPFTISVPAVNIYTEWTQDQEERIIIQGIIDIVCKVEGKWMILDYKTDRISDRYKDGFNEAKSVLQERYGTQIELYAQAIEEIWKVSVDRKLLYFFDGGHVLEVD